MKLKLLLAALLMLLAAPPARAAGTLPLALTTQFDNQGNLLGGCLLYFYVAGTVATQQQVYQDFGLTQPAPNPLPCSAGGRLPMFWLADGLTHIRLTDSGGTVQIDTTMQVLGPSSGGGGSGGGTVDSSSVANTGDVKARLDDQPQAGWLELNGLTIGNPTSGATQRANADTQALFVYLWQFCTNAHCPVPGGRGATALADYNANKQITLPDMRARIIVGRNCMESGACSTRMTNTNVSGGETADTALASGGLAYQTALTTIGKTNLPAMNFSTSVSGTVNISVSGANHSHNTNEHGGHAHSVPTTQLQLGTGGGFPFLGVSGGVGTALVTNNAFSGITINNSGILSMSDFNTITLSGSAASGGSGAAASSAQFDNFSPFLLGTYFIKL